MASVAVGGPGASYVRFTKTGRKFTPSQVRWMESQILKGTTRSQISVDFGKRFKGAAPLGNRSYTRLRSFVKASQDAAEILNTGELRGGPADINFHLKKATLYGNPQAPRVMVSATVDDDGGGGVGGERHRNFSVREENVSRENVADTAVDMDGGQKKDSGPLGNPIDEPIEELGGRIEVWGARRVVKDGSQ